MATEPDLAIIAEAENGEEAIEQFEVHRPDVVLMDLRMPVMDGLVATRAILADHPDARIIVLSTYDGDADIYRALDAGARGYVLKDMLRTEILTMVRRVHRGERGIPAPVAARLEEHTPRVELTPRETEVFQFVARADELTRRLAKEPVKIRVLVQLPNPGDPTSDASVVWPDDRKLVELGVVTLTTVAPDNAETQRKLAFNPIYLCDGIQLSDDPLPAVRSAVYALSVQHRANVTVSKPSATKE